ncbi:hypothetical protein DUI87_05136 [Hirundo rustica rustica]|uniref:Uncharacterized protein n=1 Tax=Hirundo rustica rustica TaxID=333673 RepID=A0A3M0KWE0_HIRRU|nr:hypothetical protein DUI87_05136 [Hirundo rustica rustica]
MVLPHRQPKPSWKDEKRVSGKERMAKSKRTKREGAGADRKEDSKESKGNGDPQRQGKGCNKDLPGKKSNRNTPLQSLGHLRVTGSFAKTIARHGTTQWEHFISITGYKQQ